MITKQIIKSEIDNVPDQHLDLLYKVVKALETSSSPGNYDKLSWNEFIKQTYGCLADDPITRGEQGKYEVRETIQ